MHRSASGWCAVGVMAGLLTAPAEAVGAGERTATVRVYDIAKSVPADRAAALATAEEILASGSVNVRWLDCVARPAACEAPVGVGELVIRILRGPTPAHAWVDLSLGQAVIDPQTGTAIFATIYVDRVNAKAGKAGVDARVLMGRAIAHELGHLLLATTAHTSHGLMRAIWTNDELRRNLASEWTFNERDAADLALRASR